MANWHRYTKKDGRKVWVNLDAAAYITTGYGDAEGKTLISFSAVEDFIVVTESVEEVASAAQRSNG